MKAIRVHQYGGSDMLRYEDVEPPFVGPGDVLIRVVAASVNPIDWKIREGWLQQVLRHRLPLTLGWDVSGVVEVAGESVRNFRRGDAVYAFSDLHRNGCYAQYAAVRESEVARKPGTVSHVEAASLPMAGTTAWNALVQVAAVGAGQRVLIHAGAGGVGSLAIQIARWKGAHVIATASESNRGLVESLGAGEVIDYRSTRFQDVVRGVDVVLDTLGGQTQEDSFTVLRPGGLLISTINAPAEDRASAAGVRGLFVMTEPSATALEKIAELVDNGKLRPVVGAEYALAEAGKAQELSQTGRSRGKIVLTVG
jgi:NADPH:quinone reductase-like Zn-dependent oxidoreductase